jgi:ABC-type amino acid transport substrate-binding protein
MNARTDSVLRVGIDSAPPVPLQTGSPEAGNFSGYEVDMLQEIAKRLNFTIRYRKALWSVIIDELSGGALDLICSAATVTAEREQRVNFCIPYLKLKLAFVVCAECNASLDLSTSRIGVRSGTTAERYLLHRSNGRKPSMLSESNEELYSALQRKMLDSVIDDSPIARHFSQTMPELKYGGTFDGTEAGYAVMTRAGNTALRDQISSTISSLEGDGTLPSLRRRWFGSENLLVA